MFQKFFSRLLAWWRLRRRIRRQSIFSFHDGTRTRYADPYVIQRALATDPEVNLDRDLAGFDKGDLTAIRRLLTGIHRAFGTQPWDEASGTGLTDPEAAGLLLQLIEYLQAVKKNTSSGPNSPDGTAAQSSPEIAAPDSITKPPLDSGSTATESSGNTAG